MPSQKWNQHNSLNQTLAKQVFELQEQTHQFAPKVMEAARKVRQYIATPADVELLNQATGGGGFENVNTPLMTKVYRKNYNVYRVWGQQQRAAGQPAGGGSKAVAIAQAQAALNGVSTTYRAPGTPATASPGTAGGMPGTVSGRLTEDEKKIQDLSKRVLEVEKTKKNIGNFVLGAAERIAAGKGTAADAKIVDAWGDSNKPKRSPAGKNAFLTGMKKYGRYGRIASRYGNAGQNIASGDIGDAVNAAADFLPELAKDAKRLSRNKAVKAFANVVASRMGAKDGAGAEAVSGAATGIAALDNAIRIAQGVGKLVHGGARMIEELVGSQSSDSIRIARSELNLARTQSGRDPIALRLSALQLAREEIDRGSKSIPFIGDKVAWLRNRGTSNQVEHLERLQSAREISGNSGAFANFKGMTDLARKRYWQEKYGNVLGTLLAMRGTNATTPEIEKEVSGKLKEMLQRADNLKARMHERISQGDFAQATKLRDAMGEELGANMNWLVPQTMFVNQDNARGAARLWPMTQTMRRLRSYE